MLENLSIAPRVEASPFGTPNITLDGNLGEATTPGLRDGQNYDQFLIDAGIDPATIELVAPARISRWQRYDGEWLTSYKFTFRTNTERLDLPTLYSVARKQAAAKKQKKTTTDKALVVLWSDLQVGKTDSRGGVQQQLERIHQVRENIVTLVKTNKPSKVVVADVGDIIENVINTAWAQQIATNDLSVQDQVDVALAATWDLIKSVLVHTDEVTYLSVASNHCQTRVAGQKIGNSHADWGVFIARTIARLAVEANLPVTVVIPNEYDESLTLDVFGDGFHRLGLAHGHQAKSPDRMATWFANQTFGHQPLAGATILVTGHFHHLQVREMGNTDRGSSRYWVQAKTLDNGSSWFRLTGGAGDSHPGVVCLLLQRQREFHGEVVVA